MRISRPYHLFRKVVRMNMKTETIERPDGSPSGEVNSFGGVPKESTETEFEQTLWLYKPTEGYVQAEFGIKETGDLSGVFIPDEYASSYQPNFQMEMNDRVTHGDQTYALETIRYLPDEENRQLGFLSFTKMEYDP